MAHYYINTNEIPGELSRETMVLYFTGVYIINRTLHGRLDKRNFSSSVQIYFMSERSERVKYFQHEKRNFESLRGHEISSIYDVLLIC